MYWQNPNHYIVIKLPSSSFVSFSPTTVPSKNAYVCIYIYIYMFFKRLFHKHFKWVLTPQINPMKLLFSLTKQCICHLRQVAHSCSQGFVMKIIKIACDKKKLDSKLMVQCNCWSLFMSEIIYYYLVTSLFQQKKKRKEYIYIYIYIWKHVQTYIYLIFHHFKWILTRQIKTFAFIDNTIYLSLVARWLMLFIEFCDA